MAEDTSSQALPPVGTKPPAPKPAATHSFSINKGKTSAPKKVVRRRAPAPTQPVPTPSTAEPTPQAQTPDPTNATPIPETERAPQLPTPAATQDVLSKHAQETEQTAAQTPIPVPVSGALEVESSSTPAPVDEVVANRLENAIGSELPSTRNRTPKPRAIEEEHEAGRSLKRRRIETPNDVRETSAEPDKTVVEPPSSVQRDMLVELTQPEPEPRAAPVIEEALADTAQPTPTVPIISEAPAIPPNPLTREDGPSDGQVSEVQAATGSTRSTRRRLPWIAVNAVRDEDVEAEPPTGKPQTKAKRKKKAQTLREIDEEEEQEQEEGSGAPDARSRSNIKVRGKRKAREPTEGDQAEDTPQTAQKPRRQSKNKGKKQGTGEDEENNENGEPVETEEARPKRIRKRKQSTENREGGLEGEEGEQQPKRRGRPSRQPTPSDAEDEVIDTSNTFMDSLASRNIRVGKLSQRERKMREINWDEVKERRKEQERRQANGGRELQAQADQQLQEAVAANEQSQTAGPRMEYVDGQIRYVEGSGTIDREAQAAREREGMQIITEDDLTSRVTNKSFLNTNRRFPEDFMLPGQGKRWNIRDTDDFYAALAMFGTDFMMISTIFPGATRRSVKLKFTREERANPQRVKETLHGRVNSDWNQYLTSSGRKDDSFVDPDEIMRELDEERRAMEIEIEKAKAAAEEEKRQRRLAGVESDDEGGEKENGKGKKKGKRVAKQVSFEPEDGVEILGDIDENDDGWGRE